ncbi:hypothetical protein HYR69_11635, partial [Candidatus Sumerlaeota bacterium]|nr:hypothetical protein [Candidatus Sumerlaeota bacterium]
MRCGYCAFPLTPAEPLPSIKKVQEEVARARKAGLVQMRIISGEGIETHAALNSTIRYYGFNSFADYLKAVIGEITKNSVVPPLFPELDIGALALTQLQQMRSHIFTLRLYLETMDKRLQDSVVHGTSPAKWPRHRLSALITAGKLGIPVNSGIMAGLGETADSRAEALKILAELSDKYRNIQSVTIQPFIPQAGTVMADSSAPAVEELIGAVAEARRILPHQVVVSFPMVQYPERVMDFVRAGVDDLGDFELSGDAEKDAPALAAFKIAGEILAKNGIRLRDRLSLMPKFSNAKWVTERYAKLL